MNLSKSKIDRLGNELRQGRLTEDNLRLLDEYRRSFSSDYEVVVKTIRDKLKLKPTGRPAKSTTSIREKLLRESIRLTQIQDIAGCRVIVEDMTEQDSVVKSLRDVFPTESTSVIDRREKPSHGYRAVHIIVALSRKLVEVQVRSTSQHLWAELSEKLSDVIDPKIKYGGGNEEVQKPLLGLSKQIANFELAETKLITDLDGLDTKSRSDTLDSKNKMRKILDDTIKGFIDSLK